MKYKIVGWVDFECNEFPRMKFISDNAYISLIREIREKGLVISGYDHQENGWVPLFNTGEVLKYTSRGWGNVMADALEYEQKTGYEYSYYGVGGGIIGYNKDIIYYRDEVKLPKLEDICDYYRIYISKETLDNYKKGDVIFPMYINTELDHIDCFDRIIFIYKEETIETEVIGKMETLENAKEEEITEYIISYIDDEKESIKEELENEEISYSSEEREEINKKLRARYLSILEPVTTIISNKTRKVLVLRTLKDDLKH